ncbi:hypothetical protein V499_08332 [Pseudogymnoascus sp. VKM F-103]|nr:hypothetical protein V499_08332 [Pseudogymnoascus sp. VKM F-103]
MATAPSPLLQKIPSRTAPTRWPTQEEGMCGSNGSNAETRKKAAAGEAAMKRASDSQYARKKEFMRKKAEYKRRFPATNDGVMRAKRNLDAAIKWYQCFRRPVALLPAVVVEQHSATLDTLLRHGLDTVSHCAATFAINAVASTKDIT